MAKVVEVLKTLNGTFEIDFPNDENGAVGIEYGLKADDGATGATGTIVAEGSIIGTLKAGSELNPSAADVAAQWYPLKIHKNDESIVDNLAAPGMGYVEVTGWDKVRIRMSVPGNVVVGMNFQRP